MPDAPQVVVSGPKTPVAPGAKFTVRLTVTFAPGLHGYQNPPADPFQIPLSVTVANKDIRVASVKYPAGVPKIFQGERVMVYEGATVVTLELVAPKKAGNVPVRLNVRYQQCDDTSCWPPETSTVTMTLRVQRPTRT